MKMVWTNESCRCLSWQGVAALGFTMAEKWLKIKPRARLFYFALLFIDVRNDFGDGFIKFFGDFLFDLDGVVE